MLRTGGDALVDGTGAGAERAVPGLAGEDEARTSLAREHSFSPAMSSPEPVQSHHLGSAFDEASAELDAE